MKRDNDVVDCSKESGFTRTGGGRQPYLAARGEPAMPLLTSMLPLSTLLDELSFGVAVVDDHGTLLHASRAARMQLQSQHGLAIRDGMIETQNPDDDRDFRRALVAAADGRRSYLAVGHAGKRLDVAVLPIEFRCLNGDPVAILVFEKSAGSGGLCLYFFAQAYGLTRAEQSVLAELSDGASVVEAARQLGSSVHTVRTHVRNILSKTGQANLRALTRRIGMLPPVGARFAVAHARGEALAACAGRPPSTEARPDRTRVPVHLVQACEPVA
jgi:hypothetical protein